MIGVLQLVALSILVVLLVLWVFLLFKNWRDAQPIVLPISEKLTTFRTACHRLGLDFSDGELLEAYSNRLPKFENPYIAAMEDWVKRWRALTSPGGEVCDRPTTETLPPSSGNTPESDRVDIEQDLRLHAISEFVIEGHLSHDEGKRYFDQVTEMWRNMLARNGLPPFELTGFDAMLDAQRIKRSNPPTERHAGALS